MSTSSHDDSTHSSPDQLQDAAATHRIVARRGDGSAYQGDLLRDIVRYRNLRALSLAGGTFTDEQRSLLQSLEARVRQPREEGSSTGESALRSFYRFQCDFTASLRQEESGEESTVNVADISAGGVKLVGTNAQELGDAVIIRFDRGSGDAVEFAARVAWARDIEYGVMFAGAAQVRSS